MTDFCSKHGLYMVRRLLVLMRHPSQPTHKWQSSELHQATHCPSDTPRCMRHPISSIDTMRSKPICTAMLMFELLLLDKNGGGRDSALHSL